MPQTSNTALVSHIDCAGGGQIWIQNTTMYVGHMRHPTGTSIYDIADPRKPKLLARLDMPEGWHSHKVRAANGLMLVNHERNGDTGPKDFGGGLAIYNVAQPDRPRLITKWMTAGKGVHRFDFDGRYAYISPTVEGYIGNIVMILDLADPANPKEVGRWWIPGQWQAGDEVYPWGDGVAPKCHHPLRFGDRLYVSYWHHGLYILDISNMSKPKMIGHLNSSPAFPHPTHTCLRIPQKLKGRDIMVVADEDVAKLRPSSPAFAWIYDISTESQPFPIATFQVQGVDTDGSPQPPMTGCHQPSERFHGTVIPFAWFAQGLRLVDIADPFSPKEVGYFLPDAPVGGTRCSANDVTVDDRGLIYLVDRVNGIDVIETNLIR